MTHTHSVSMPITVSLFGGAMSCAIPDSMTDISTFRQVPDHQEVYADEETGATLIVELLSRQPHVSDDHAPSFYFNDLAQDNGCTPAEVSVTTAGTLPPSAYPHLATLPQGRSGGRGCACTYACLTTGYQRVSKFTNESGKANEVFVGLAVLRFPPPVSTEVLVSLSALHWIHPESSEAKVVTKLLSEEERAVILHRAVASLQVHDWGLFVQEG